MTDLKPLAARPIGTSAKKRAKVVQLVLELLVCWRNSASAKVEQLVLELLVCWRNSASAKVEQLVLELLVCWRNSASAKVEQLVLELLVCWRNSASAKVEQLSLELLFPVKPPGESPAGANAKKRRPWQEAFGQRPNCRERKDALARAQRYAGARVSRSLESGAEFQPVSARRIYSSVSVSIVTVSPAQTKGGTMILTPFSKAAGL